MTTPAEEDKYWADRLEELHHNALKNVRDVAGKWQTAIVALLGAFATVAFVWGPDKLEKFPLAGAARTWALSLLVVGGLLGVTAAFLLALAAIGIPREYATMTSPKLEDWTQNRARDAAGQLWRGMVAAALAGLLVLGVSVWVLVGAVTKAPEPTSLAAIVTDSSGAVCGNLIVKDGGLSVEVNNRASPIDGSATVTIVTACPDTVAG
jgi:hypothetical protein